MAENTLQDIISKLHLRRGAIALKEKGDGQNVVRMMIHIKTGPKDVIEGLIMGLGNIGEKERFSDVQDGERYLELSFSRRGKEPLPIARAPIKELPESVSQLVEYVKSHAKHTRGQVKQQVKQKVR